MWIEHVLQKCTMFVVVETALELLQKAFSISVRTHTDAKPYITDTLQLLNLGSLE